MARKELKLLHNRGMLLHHTGHVVTSYGARCYIIRGTLLQQRTCGSQSQVLLVRVTVIALIGLYTFIHLTHSVHNNVGVHSLATKGDTFSVFLHNKQW